MSVANDDLHVRLVSSFPGMAYRCLHDADWTLEFVSDGASDLLGYSPDDLVVQRVVAVSDLVHPDDLARVSLAVEKGLSAREPFACTYRMRTEAGHYIWVSEVGRGVIAEDGSLEAIEGFLVDVTAQVEAQEASRLAERRETLARLATGIAHDFNNLLTGILGSVAALRHASESAEPLDDDFALIESLVERAAELTGQLLAFGRPGPVDHTPIDVLASLARLEPILTGVVGAGVDVTVELSPGPAPCRIDPVRLEQVVLNLAVNGRDAMPDGGRLRVAAGVDLDAQEVRIAVSDSGAGIPPEVLPRIFEPYYTTRDLVGGTGLGLATVKAIVDETGGRVSVQSEPGSGTTFEIRLPLLRAEVAGAGPVGTEVILLVEDDEAVRSVIARGLRRFGYTVLEAADGLQAVKLGERHKGPLDLLVTDASVPRGGGVELCRTLRESRPGLPAILVSGDRSSVPEGLFDGRLEKPVLPRDVARCARDVLDRSDG